VLINGINQSNKVEQMEHTPKKQYRIEEFKNIEEVYNEYNPKIKVISPNGETKWLDITNEELTAIRELLTK